MAVYKLFPDKDNFIFTEVPQANAGYDEMIELGSYPVLEVGQTSRFLIHFSDNDIPSKAGVSRKSFYVFNVVC